jgi:hypothetical protein
MIKDKKFKKQVVSSKLNFPSIDLAIFLPFSLSSTRLLNNLTKLKVPKYFLKVCFFKEFCFNSDFKISFGFSCNKRYY